MTTGNELTMREHHDLEVQRDPARVIETAINAAKVLKDVVSKKTKPVIINGEQYLEFEDLQLLGQFYGYTVRSVDAEPVEVNGVQGAKARAELIDFRTGEVAGGAVAYCMADEDMWRNRPWFQLASMAQTRAGAKAFRNRLAWIVVLAGYKATPAEEMTGDEKAREREAEHFCPIHKTAFKKFTKDGRSWYSHKLPDGGYCNEDKIAPQAPIEHQAKPAASPKADSKPAGTVDPAIEPQATPPPFAEADDLLKQIYADAKYLDIGNDQLDQAARKEDMNCRDLQEASLQALQKIAKGLAMRRTKAEAEGKPT